MSFGSLEPYKGGAGMSCKTVGILVVLGFESWQPSKSRTFVHSSQLA